jgi:hypothetical protein
MSYLNFETKVRRLSRHHGFEPPGRLCGSVASILDSLNRDVPRSGSYWWTISSSHLVASWKYYPLRGRFVQHSVRSLGRALWGIDLGRICGAVQRLTIDTRSSRSFPSSGWASPGEDSFGQFITMLPKGVGDGSDLQALSLLAQTSISLSSSMFGYNI